jgi:ABC-2 type transport system ATP-binding protein
MKLLEVINLNKKYRKKRVLKDVSFFLCANEIVGLVGRNGVGKSTTIKVILGLQKGNSGDVLINGYDLNKDYIKAINCVSGIVELPGLYNYLSGLDNLKLIKKMYRNVTEEVIGEVIKLVGLEDGIEDKVYKYSLGMRQRLGIACCLLSKPKVLILDEPTNGLDPLSIVDLRNILFKLRNDGVGILISSHNLSELENICDRVYFMDDGKIIKECKVDSDLEKMYLDVLGDCNG